MSQKHPKTAQNEPKTPKSPKPRKTRKKAKNDQKTPKMAKNRKKHEKRVCVKNGGSQNGPPGPRKKKRH